MLVPAVCQRICLASLLTACTLFTTLSGCGASKREQQLHRVAKDWSETIRASQVIPVYPLTEDLRPGYVFLVRTSIAEQAVEWKRRGYLSLDDHRVRLGQPRPEAAGSDDRIDYSRMYFDGYWKDSFFQKNGNPRPLTSSPGPRGDGGSNASGASPSYSDANAPRAAFPSYDFEVRTGSSLGAAFPIKGIPVAMSFMRADRAFASVSLYDAYTYGADAGQLYGLLKSWVETAPGVKVHLSDAVDQHGRPVFLRVVSRVYLAGALSVTLNDAGSGGSQGRVGLTPQLPNQTTSGESVRESVEQVLEALDERANAPMFDSTGQPVLGGAVRFTWATDRHVSLNEAFPTPLVIGYLGFDVPVFEGGRLGYPLPTWGVLNQTSVTTGISRNVLLGLDLLVQLARGTKETQVRAISIVRGVSKQMVDRDLSTDDFKKHAEEADRLLTKPDGWAQRVLPLIRSFQITESFLSPEQRSVLHDSLARFIDQSG